MSIEILSYILAIVVGLVCFGLVKHTADEFDRWYEQPRFVRPTIRVPLAVVSVLVVTAAFLLLR